jgi:hypothetical protein
MTTTMTAHLLRWLARDGLRRMRHTPRPSLPSPPRIWTVLVAVTPAVDTGLISPASIL